MVWPALSEEVVLFVGFGFFLEVFNTVCDK